MKFSWGFSVLTLQSADGFYHSTTHSIYFKVRFAYCDQQPTCPALVALKLLYTCLTAKKNKTKQDKTNEQTNKETRTNSQKSKHTERQLFSSKQICQILRLMAKGRINNWNRDCLLFFCHSISFKVPRLLINFCVRMKISLEMKCVYKYWTFPPVT